MGAQATGAGATGAGARGAPDTGAPWQGAARADAQGAEARADRAPPAAGPVTAYRLYWPLRRGAGHHAQDRQPAPTGPSLQGATLLVVDGDRESGEVLHAFLEGLGADVALCDSAEIAAEAAREEPEAWTALIIDYDMPGMSGGALVDGLRPVAPDLPVFVVTAMADRMSDPRILEAPNTRLYPRPADLGALAQDLAALPPRGPARFA
jgi:CheY-like chemotaxis protein